jgi:predicted transcriptional regulator of viral defense system
MRRSISIYMDSLAFTKMLEGGRSAVLTTQQLAVLLNMDVGATAVKTKRLVDKGVLVRVLRGRYTLPSTNILAAASSIYHPSYVTLLAAFEYHGTTTQSTRVIDILNTAHSGRISLSLEAGQYVVRFVKVDAKLVYGFEKVFPGGRTALVAMKEKGIVDSLLLPGYVSLDETVACIRSGIQGKRAIEFGKRTQRQTVIKRLGFLLSAEGIDCSPEDFPGLSRTYVPLDPAHPRRGKYDPKWRVVINRVIE